MHPLYFGLSEAPLFGIYHPPQDLRKRRGVLLCYPGPEEAMRIHWAYRNLTQALLRAGLHVFRFDYYGTGDSSGPTGEGTCKRWLEDLELAAQEFVAISQITTLSLVGARLGATLAGLAPLTTVSVSIDQRLLWDPVVNGTFYLAELEALQKRRIANSRYPLERLLDAHAPEVLGYPQRPAMIASLRRLDWLTQPVTAARRFTVLLSENNTLAADLATYLRTGAPTDNLTIDEPCRWAKQEVLEQAVLPTRVIECISERLQAPAASGGPA